jgi:hypothetical protein
MGRKLRIGAAAASLLLIGSVAVASATSSPPSDKDGRKLVVLDFDAQGLAFNVDDQLPTGPSLGDRYTSAIDLYRVGTKVKVGEESAICTISRVEANKVTRLHCTGVQTVPGGQVTSEGVINYGPGDELFFKADPYSTAIKGGTGKYRTAHGDTRIQDVDDDEFRLTLRIIL